MTPLKSFTKRSVIVLFANRIVVLAALLDLLFMFYCVMTGFPPSLAGHSIRLKNLNVPFIFFMAMTGAAIALYPGEGHTRERFSAFRRKAVEAASNPASLWIVFGLACLLLTWQQITEYLAVDINFLPFSFYDYMLYYYFHGKIHYTGLLHTYYHANNILFLLAPLWRIFQSPWVLILSYGPIAALAALPLYAFARERFRDPLPALFTAVLYFNYRYLQNVMRMNFSVEIFYPLFIFSAVAAAHKSKWTLYYPAVFLGLCVKEDSFLYFMAIGLLTAFLKPKAGTRVPNWAHGIMTIVLSISYYLALTHLFIPWTGNDILHRDFNNFKGFGNSQQAVILNLLTHPHLLFDIFFGDPEKIKTYWNLLFRLGFMPLLTPAGFLIFAPLFPLFLHLTGDDVNFFNLRFHYAAAVLPFVFIAFVFGFSNLLSRLSGKAREFTLWGIMIALLAINGGHFRTEKITKDSLKSIHWAQNIPAGKNLVTHGHLLPYVGYRKYNYYFAVPFELETHPYHKPFMEADYYLLDTTVNPYPMDPSYVETKIQTLRQDSRYELVLEDSKRFLFRRKPNHA